MKSTLLKMKKLIFIVIALVIAAVSVFFAIEEDARQKETICRLFRVAESDISDVSLQVYDVLTHEDALHSRSIPRQDAEYCVEGSFTLISGELPQRGEPATPQTYATYRGAKVEDRVMCDDYKSLILKTKRRGVVLFSPSARKIYFKLYLEP